MLGIKKVKEEFEIGLRSMTRRKKRRLWFNASQGALAACAVAFGLLGLLADSWWSQWAVAAAGLAALRAAYWPRPVYP